MGPRRCRAVCSSSRGCTVDVDLRSENRTSSAGELMESSLAVSLAAESKGRAKLPRGAARALLRQWSGQNGRHGQRTAGQQRPEQRWTSKAEALSSPRHFAKRARQEGHDRNTIGSRGSGRGGRRARGKGPEESGREEKGWRNALTLGLPRRWPRASCTLRRYEKVGQPDQG
ncbi:hypothetical protein, conserved in T. vivax [Trypanosoma vivax Y486]|uniref:Uncharacterized protein n=1 Tax=Trypanosoma vivax (strain Y486) TaxID=1055687 RepID=F9WQ54_TRYVY|nr:hypothetical protein, conserved in T. vivax [Trypanosoma vivax Y486]|eukprot:CCD19681.1 hypothetical protein, conserved in T. vivax [Trypanosoma vivax Y486]